MFVQHLDGHLKRYCITYPVTLTITCFYVRNHHWIFQVFQLNERN